jgi:hypothetical protein
MATKLQHVFLSYCHDNKDEVARLRDDLIASGERVWWDDEILPGEDWKSAIRRAMKSSYAVVLCLSEEIEARAKSGVYPEIMDAIDAYRQYSPGSIFLVPVRLSECEIPDVELDATRTLDRLQYVDLFPDDKRIDGLQRLLTALRRAPSHP